MLNREISKVPRRWRRQQSVFRQTPRRNGRCPMASPSSCRKIAVRQWPACRRGAQPAASTEDKHLGAGLSHILEHMLFKGTKTRSTNADRAKNPGRRRLHQCLHFIRSHCFLDRCAERWRRDRARYSLRRDDEFDVCQRRSMPRSRRSSGVSLPWAWTIRTG